MGKSKELVRFSAETQPFWRAAESVPFWQLYQKQAFEARFSKESAKLPKWHWWRAEGGNIYH